MKGVFGHDCLYLAARDHAGRIEGVLPLVRVKSRIFGHFLVSMPFLNYGGPVGSPRATALLAERPQPGRGMPGLPAGAAVARARVVQRTDERVDGIDAQDHCRART